MAFSFEPLLAISAGHIMAVSAGPEQLDRSPDLISAYALFLPILRISHRSSTDKTRGISSTFVIGHALQCFFLHIVSISCIILVLFFERTIDCHPCMGYIAGRFRQYY